MSRRYWIVNGVSLPILVLDTCSGPSTIISSAIHWCEESKHPPRTISFKSILAASLPTSSGASPGFAQSSAVISAPVVDSATSDRPKPGDRPDSAPLYTSV
ncbi:hypothetical protein J3B02_006433 [Coemansia erecta]|nr:hypothetical protein J3B02_006433 [Coemansia erecta]